MNSTVRHALMFVAILLPLLASGQDEVVLANGSTIRGTVNRQTTTFVTIFSATTQKDEKFFADEINYVHRNSGSNPNSYVYSKRLFRVNSKEGPAVPRLLRLRSFGKIKTYSIIENQGRSSLVQYYLEKDDSGLIFIGFSSGLFSISNDVMTAREITQQVSRLFGDNTLIQKQFNEDKKNGQRKTIQAYVQRYNQMVEHDLHE